MTIATRSRATGIMLAPLRWLERSRGWRRRLLIVAYLIVGLIGGVLIWRATSLNNLPDVGDPFDVKAFVRSSWVAESEDAFVLYRKAGEAMKNSTVTNNWNLMWLAVRSGWTKAPPEVREWTESNREALKIWREGTKRPGGIPERLEKMGRFDETPLNHKLYYLGQAALLEGSKFQEAGDLAGALEWYLAAARSCHHLSNKSRLSWRQTAENIGDQTRDRLIAWAFDPRTNATLLRKALDEVLSLDARTPPTSDALKAEYISLIRSVGDPSRMVKESGSQLNLSYSHEQTGRWLAAYILLRREPERARRVVQLFFANWLAQCDKPVASRPRLIGNDPRYPIWGVYVADPTAAPGARAIAPERLFAWLDSTMLTWRVLTMYPMNFPDAFRDRQSRSVLIVTLAEQLYQRETGRESPSVQALVPKYLKAVPEGYK